MERQEGSLPERSQWLRPQRTLRCTGDKTGRTGNRQATVIVVQFLKCCVNVCVDRRQPLTSLVLQMSPSVDPQALPGVAFHGIIPVAMK